MKDLIYLVPLLPLIGFIINGLFWKSMPKKFAGILASGTVLASFILSVLIFFDVKADPNADPIIHIYDFIVSGSVRIPFDFQVDELSSLFILIITGVGFLIHVFSTGYMKEDEGFVKYFAFLNFFVFSMLILVLAANYVIMFAGWEGVGLASYLLIGFWFKNKDYTNAGKKSFIMNRIGDLGFLVGTFLVLYHFGTASYQELFSQLDHGTTVSTGVMNAIAISFFIGATGKSAQIPLYTWLPDAMAGPTPVSALIHAATMVTAGIYMVARSNALYNLAPLGQTIVAVTGLLTALIAASIAIKQYDIKKVLAYSTVSQLGYMFLALGVGAYVGGVFHVMTHAFFKALLFLGAGSVIHAMSGEQDLRKMGGLGKYMPITKITFLIACLAIAGIPGFSGFFSKDEILAAAYAKHPAYYVLALAGSLMTAFYMFRLYFYVFTGEFRGGKDLKEHLHESPVGMTFPLIVLAVLSIVGGFVGLPAVMTGSDHLLSQFLAPVVQNFGINEVSHSTEWILMSVTAILVVVMIYWAKINCQDVKFEKNVGFSKLLENKYYVDEIYSATVEEPIKELGRLNDNLIERKGIDGIVNGIGKLVTWMGAKVRLIQNGQVGYYMFGIVLGMILLFIVGFFF